MGIQKFLFFLALFLTLFFFVTSFFITIQINDGQQFSHLAESFLHGRLDFLSTVDNHHDTVLFNGRYYWPLGPFPIILLLPFVWIAGLFNIFFYQGYLLLPIVFFTVLVIYSIGIRIGFSRQDSFFWTFAFCFGSVYMAVLFLSQSWYFSHSIVVLFLFLSLYEYLYKKRFWVIGLCLACAFATRVPAGISCFFFILILVYNKNKSVDMMKLVTPLIIAGLCLGAYNEIRFGSIVEQGYSYQQLIPPLEKARSYGVFHPIHVMTNLYYFFLKSPDPVFKDNASHVLQFPFVKADYWGISIFITSPYFLWLLKSKKWNTAAKFLMITIFCIAVPIFLYYGVGVTQYGYRYALDFLPLLFFLLMTLYYRKNKTLSIPMKSVFVLSGIINFYLFLTFMRII